MESNFDNRDFEQYVKKNADQYRMIPSEKVWKSISNNLHFRRRWYGLGLTMLLLGIGIAVTWVMISFPASQKQSITSIEKSTVSPNTIPDNTPDGGSNKIDKFDKLDPVALVKNQSNNETITTSQPDALLPVLIDYKVSDPGLVIQSDKAPTSINNAFVKAAGKPLNIFEFDEEVMDPFIQSDNYTSVSKNNQVSLLMDKTVGGNSNVRYPLTIESVLNSYQAKKPKFSKKVSWQLYFAPTVSYRKLSNNRSYKNSIVFFNNQGYGYPFTPLTDVNNEVTHKPDLGLELGLVAGYPLSKSLKLTAGLQFNINRYDIRAYVYNREQATINLNGGTANGSNSLTTWTSYRNYNGYKSDWLKNFYFSVSAPIGAQLRLFGNNKTNYGIAGTVQPSYILRDRAYLISTDYKNYAEVPDLIRHFNMNTSFETFVSYKKRNTTWQIGPQVRYQVLSSFQSKYPVKENLFDFGLKVGISLNQ